MYHGHQKVESIKQAKEGSVKFTTFPAMLYHHRTTLHFIGALHCIRTWDWLFYRLQWELLPTHREMKHAAMQASYSICPILL